MGYGYSVRLLKSNAAADPSLLGVRLGQVCIEQDVSVQAVAAALNVSRQTIYNWFKGDYAPHPKTDQAICDFIAGLS